MRNIIKKISSVLMALMLLSGIIVLSNEQVVFAENVNYTVNFHYVRADKNYGNYSIKAYTITDNEGKNGTFTASGDEGVFTYTFTADTEIDDSVNFIIQVAGTTTEEVPNKSVTLNFAASSMDIYINGDTKEVSLTPITAAPATTTEQPTTTAAAEQPTTQAAVEQPTTQAAVEQPTTPAAPVSNEGDVKQYKQDDPDADYSVGTFKAIIIDIVIFAALGAFSYYKLGQDKKPAAGKKL